LHLERPNTNERRQSGPQSGQDAGGGKRVPLQKRSLSLPLISHPLRAPRSNRSSAGVLLQN